MPSAGICPVCGKNQPNGVHKHAAGRGRYMTVKNMGPVVPPNSPPTVVRKRR